MSRHVLPIRLGVVLCATATHASAAGPPSFQGIGALPGSRFGSFARDISADGTAVTGNSDQADIGGSSFMAFRWKDGVMTPLGDLPGGSNLSESGGISSDGSVCAGMSFSASGTEAFRWAGGVMEGLGDLPGGDFYSHAFDVSDDGTTVVGISRPGPQNHPFVWRDGVMRDLADDFPEGLGAGEARAVSSDGRIIVGQAGIGVFRWTDGVIETLTQFPDGTLWARPFALSSDGLTMAGELRMSGNFSQAFCEVAGALVGLGDLPGGPIDSRAHGVSNGGGVVVGRGLMNHGDEAFIWTPAAGMRRMWDVLTHDFGLDLVGWWFYRADGVSADGRTIAGSGINPQGRPEAWIAHIGCVPGDTNNDGACSAFDIDRLIACLLAGQFCGCADANEDGFIDGRDIGAFVACVIAS